MGWGGPKSDNPMYGLPGYEGWAAGVPGSGVYGPQGLITTGPGMWDWGYTPGRKGNQTLFDPMDRAFTNMFIQAGKAGLFDPMGSQGMLDYLEQLGNRNLGARQRQIDTQLRAAGGLVDPSMYGYGRLMATLGAQGDTADELSRARLQSMQANQEWLRNLASAYLQSRIGSHEALGQMWRSNEVGNRNRPGVMDWIGQLGGLGLGALGFGGRPTGGGGVMSEYQPGWA